MPAKPTDKDLSGFVGSTPAEAPQPHPDRVANPGANSIQKAREDRDAATGYDDLLAEVEAIEAQVDGSTPDKVRSEVVALRNKVERPPLREDFSSSANSIVVRKQNVDNVRAVAQALAAKV